MNRRLLYQVPVSVLVVFLLGSVFYYALCKGLRRTDRDSIGKFNYLVNDTTRYNTLFVGSSRVHTALNPVIFDSINGTHSFNAGMDGIRITELNLIVKKFIKSHHAPDNIFINIDGTTLSVTQGVWQFPQYYPYIHDPDFRELTDLEPKLKLGKYAPALALTYFDDPLKNLGLIGLTKKGGNYEELVSLKGFQPTPPHELTTDTAALVADFAREPRGWQLLEETLNYCRENNVHIYFLIAPMYNYTLADSAQVFFQKLDSIQRAYNVQTFNFMNDKRFDSPKLFADRTHLNSVGAEMYSAIVARQFKGNR